MRLAGIVLASALLGACTSGMYQQPSGRPATTGAQSGTAAGGNPGTRGAVDTSQPGPFPRSDQPVGPIAPGAAGGPGSPDFRNPGPFPRSDSGAAGPDGGAVARLPDAPAAVTGPTAALLAQSQSQRDNGDFDRAAETLERAIAIAPDAAALWVELAEIRLLQGSPALAQETARKALTLTGDDAALAARARRLIPR